MLYYVDDTVNPQPLRPIDGVKFEETSDISLLSALCKIPAAEVTRRLANDHNAFVGYYKNIPAAFGWMAKGKAAIGELGHEFVLPVGHRYLWNFRTVESYRGKGIYPRLLQHIVAAELHRTKYFWIMHAPENKASKSGIEKAGFAFAGQVSVLGSSVIFGPNDKLRDFGDLVGDLGFNTSGFEQAKCWKCSSPYLRNSTISCCCEAEQEQCNRVLFQSA